MAKTNRNIVTDIGSVELPTYNDRRIYNDSNVQQFADPQAVSPGYAIRQPKRTPAVRKHSTTNIVGLMFSLAILGLLYVSNVIAVNQLAKEIGDLTTRYNSALSTNEVLKAEINRKSSLDRINVLAQEKVGLTNPKEAPVWFEIDQEKIETLSKK